MKQPETKVRTRTEYQYHKIPLHLVCLRLTYTQHMDKLAVRQGKC